MNEQIQQQTEALRPFLGQYQRRAFAIGLLGLLATVAGFFIDQEQFFRSYLLGFIYWIGLPLGCMVILMIHHVAGGTWGFAIRRLLEAGTRTLPLMAILALPILAGIHQLYEWSHPEAIAADEILQHKSAYLNEPFFIARTVAYFIVWGIFAYLLNRWSSTQDQTADDTSPTRRLQLLSGPGILVYALTVTFASIDWIMSLEPHWYSTIYGVIYMVGQALQTWAFIALVAVLLARRPPLDQLLTNQRLRDLGTFMLACVMLWAYVSFSQFLIIWAGNLPEEITWYMTRLEGGWLAVGILLIAFHFALPMVLLVSSRIKARPPILAAVSIGLLIMRLVDLFWITAPAFYTEGGYHSTGFQLHWLDFTAPIGIGGLWVALFFSQLQKRPLVALNDPRFQDLLAGEEHHG